MGNKDFSQETLEKLRFLLAKFLASRAADPMGLKAVAKKHEAIPVHSDMGGCLLVDVGGRILAYDWETEQVNVENDGFWQDLAFRNLFEKYPDLKPAKAVPTALALTHLAAAHASPLHSADIPAVEPARRSKRNAPPAKSGTPTSRKSS